MTAGFSGSYGINGTNFSIQPTTGRWMPKTPLGIGGDGHIIYPGVREFELTWQLSDPSAVNQLQTFFDAINNTGTAVVDLPRYNYASYQFYSYTGCVLGEPEQDVYFNEHQTSILLIVSNIRT